MVWHNLVPGSRKVFRFDVFNIRVVKFVNKMWLTLVRYPRTEGADHLDTNKGQKRLNIISFNVSPSSGQRSSILWFHGLA